MINIIPFPEDYALLLKFDESKEDNQKACCVDVSTFGGVPVFVCENSSNETIVYPSYIDKWGVHQDYDHDDICIVQTKRCDRCGAKMVAFIDEPVKTLGLKNKDKITITRRYIDSEDAMREGKVVLTCPVCCVGTTLKNPFKNMDVLEGDEL